MYQSMPEREMEGRERERERERQTYPPSDGVPVQYTAQPTNGVTYFRALNSCHELPDDLLPYLPLFCAVIPR